MAHLVVLVFLIDLLVGSWAALLVWQRYQRYGVSQLRRLFDYVVAFNLMVLGYLVAQYAFTNLIGENPLAFPRPVLVLSVGVYPIEIAVAWTALRLAWDLRRRAVPVRLRRAFVAGTAALGLSYAVGLVALFEHGSLQWLVSTHMLLGVVTTTVVGAAFVGLAVLRTPDLDRDQERSVRWLGWSLLAGYAALAVSSALPKWGHLLTLAATLLWLNGAPLLWLHRQLPRYHRAAAGTGAGMATVARLALERGLTPREQEVMELIVQGKSNKEIQGRLHISFSTVKNHAYSLYRKMGVASRAQLIHRVMAATSRRDGEPAIDGP